MLVKWYVAHLQWCNASHYRRDLNPGIFVFIMVRKTGVKNLKDNRSADNEALKKYPECVMSVVTVASWAVMPRKGREKVVGL